MMDGLQDSGHLPDTECHTLRWDVFCDLLDAASWDDVESKLTRGARLSAKDHVSLLREALSRPGQYFFESPAKQALEAFALKLSLCTVLCRQVAEIHERTGHAFLGLDPERVLITIPLRSTSALPLRWTCSLALEAVLPTDTFPHEDMPDEMARSVSAIPAGLDPSYTAPLVAQWPLGCELPVTALLQSIDALPDDHEQMVRGLVRVHVIADSIAAREFSDEDVFRVSLPIGAERGATIKMWARKVDTPERGIVVSGMTDAVSPVTWDMFSRSSGQSCGAATVAVYRSFTSTCDVYSCGMLLLRALLGCEADRWTRALRMLPVLLDGLSPLVQGVEEDDHYTIHERVRDRAQEWADLVAPGAVPEDLWYDALIVVLRACSRIQGFSYGLDTNPAGRRLAGNLGRDVAHLAQRARTRLFEPDEQDALIATACDRMLAELGTGR